MRRLNLAPLNPEQILELDGLYRTTRDVRLRTRAQISLLAGEQGMSSPQIAVIVRESDQTVRNWLKRYGAEGIEGLSDMPRPGAPAQGHPPRGTKENNSRIRVQVGGGGAASPSESWFASLDVDSQEAGRSYGRTDGYSRVHRNCSKVSSTSKHRPKPTSA